MIEQLHGRIDEEEGIEIVRVFIGGSNATHTTIRRTEDNEFDVDIHVYLKLGKEVDDENMRRFLRRQLIEIYPNKDKEDFETTKSSVKVIFRSGIQLNIDVVPVIHDSTRSGFWGHIPRPNGEKLYTSVPEHIEWVRSKTAKSNPPVKFNKVVRLMKWWKNYNNLKSNSFVITILTGNSFKKQTFSSNWASSVTQVFNHFHSCWVDASGTDPVQVKDPVNPENNAASGMTSNQLTKLQEKAREAEEAINKASDAFNNGNKTDCIEYLQSVFGPKIK